MGPSAPRSNPRWQRIDWFDIPRYYDMVYLPGTTRETDFILQLARTRARGWKDWLEPACGTGRILAELARRGARPTGYDINGNTLAYARRRMRRNGLRAELLQADMASFRRPAAFDAAYCAVNSLRYLPEEPAVLRHLRHTAESLRPGGIYIVGLHLADYRRRSPETERWTARRGKTRVTTVTTSWPPDPVTRKEKLRNRLYVQTPSNRFHYETVWTYRTYDLAQWKELVARTPFEIVAVYDFNYVPEMEQPIDEATDDALFVLRRP